MFIRTFRLFAGNEARGIRTRDTLIKSQLVNALFIGISSDFD